MRASEALERVLIGFSSDAQLFDALEALQRPGRDSGNGDQPASGSIARHVATGEFTAVPDAGAPISMSAQAGNIRQLKELLAQTLEVGVAARLERFPPLAEEAHKLARIARDGNGPDLWGKFSTLLRQFFFRLERRGEAEAELLTACCGWWGSCSTTSTS